MAAALKLFFSPQKIAELAAAISCVYPAFNSELFSRFCCDGLHTLELMPRALRISQGLRRFLPQDYPKAVEILMLSLGPPLQATANNGMAPFFYLPHVFFVRDYGLAHFTISMAAQYELTQRFTAEFSLRPYVLHHFEPCMALLKRWAEDPCEHVRRLVSEGTRPRLPWAAQLAPVIAQPRLTAPLLELLKDDPSLYVRRSVANHLNDIGKDNCDYLLQVLKVWSLDAPAPRAWLIKHALRSAIKRGNTQAMEVLGFGLAADIAIQDVKLTPDPPLLGQNVRLACVLRLLQGSSADVLVDLAMEFPGRSGRRRKVFNITRARLEPGGILQLQKLISLQPMTTRVYYPGRFVFTLLINGTAWPLAEREIDASLLTT
jgi:3-methyladenine DNA glycosylase AlkC